MDRVTFLALTHNVALLLGIAVIYDIFTSLRGRMSRPVRQVVAGGSIGLVAIALMSTSWVFSNGVVFDTRSVLLAVSGLFFGIVPTAIAAVAAALFRWGQGGPAALTGVCVILASGALGVGLRYIRKKPLHEITVPELVGLGFAVHLVMLALMLLMPYETALKVLKSITLPVLTIHPFGTVALGLLLANGLRRQKLSAALRQSEEEIRSTLYGIGDAVIAVDLEGQVTRMNGVAEALTGWSEGEAKRRPLREVFNIINEQSRQTVESPVARVLREGVVVGLANHTLLVARGGEERPIADSAAPVRGENGGLAGVVLVFRDQSSEREADAAIKESEARFRNVVESAPEGIFIQTRGHFAYANPSALRIFGAVHEEELVGAPVLERFHPEDRPLVATRIRQLNDHRQAVPQIEERVLRSDGGFVDVEVSATPFQFRGEKGALVFIRDISERKRAEAVIIDARDTATRANRAKDEFLARLSHELRTPLTPVLLATSQWAEEASLPAPLRSDLAMMQRNLHLESRLLDDLLDVNRILQGKLVLRCEVVDLHTQIRFALKMLDAELAAKQIAVTLDLRARPSTLAGDPTRVQQVAWNLLSNSIKFTPTGGRIVVQTSGGDDGVIECTVTDTGVGIDPDILPRLFNPFEQGGGTTTSRYGGMGLGLAICRSVVEMHAGSISIHSDVAGAGTRVRIRFPVSELQSPGPDLPAVSSTTAAPPTQRRRVLLVEDHVDTARLLSRVLRSWGYEVACAMNVADALKAADQMEMDLLVSDIGLPDGSGHDLMRQLRQQRPIPGIAVSGYGMEQDQQLSRDVGFAMHLTKPVDLQELKAALEQLLRDAEGAARLGPGL